MVRGEFEGAVAAGRVADDAPAPRPLVHPVVGAHRLGKILGEERLGLRSARYVHALRVARRRHRGPQHHQDHRPHPTGLRQFQRRTRVMEFVHQRLGGARITGQDDGRGKRTTTVPRLEVLRRQIDERGRRDPRGTPDDPYLLDPPGDLRPRPAPGRHPPLTDDPQRPTARTGGVVHDHALTVLPPEQVGPAAVEPEGLVGDQPHRREDRRLGGEQQTDPPQNGPHAPPGQPWPPATPSRRTAAHRPPPPAPAPCRS
ncbi:hypothetical protein STENM327S_07087 [Streptomyces tendae]